jgi:hypothetical protein
LKAGQRIVAEQTYRAGELLVPDEEAQVQQLPDFMDKTIPWKNYSGAE